MTAFAAFAAFATFATSSVARPFIVERPEAVHPVLSIPADGSVFAYFANEASASSPIEAIVNAEPRQVTREAVGATVMIRAGELQEGDLLELKFGATEPITVAWNVTAANDAAPLFTRGPTVVSVEAANSLAGHTLEATIAVRALDDFGVVGFGARDAAGTLFFIARPLDEIVVPLSPQPGDICFDVVALDAGLRERSAPVCITPPEELAVAAEEVPASCAAGPGASWFALVTLAGVMRRRV